MTPQDCRDHAKFNAWANRRLFEAAAALSEADYLRTCPAAYFGSLHGTLNHLLLVDQLWIGRAEGADPGFRGLDQILHADLRALRRVRETEDLRLIAFAERQSAADLTREISYRSLAGESYSTPLHRILRNLFNHQTHHRGQAHALIKDAGVDPPALDMFVFWSETEG
ncbi:MAG: DinB family protein [Kiloniellales bacterium]|nr:DinB family protein [Kiloniellales bacterium]